MHWIWLNRLMQTHSRSYLFNTRIRSNPRIRSYQSFTAMPLMLTAVARLTLIQKVSPLVLIVAPIAVRQGCRSVSSSCFCP